MRSILPLLAFLCLATPLSASAQSPSPRPGNLGGGQVGTGAVTLPALPGVGTGGANPLTPGASGTTLTSPNPTGTATGTTFATAARGTAGGGAPAGGAVAGAAVSTGSAGKAGFASNNAARSASGSAPASVSARAGGSDAVSTPGATANETSNAVANNVTAAARAGSSRGAQTILCLPAGASDVEPFLDGTNLSCAP
jgi:hypothetical protein